MQAIARSLVTNRSLKTLEWNKNATDNGALAILKSIYNDESLDAVSRSNHSLRNINFCGGHWGPKVSKSVMDRIHHLNGWSDTICNDIGEHKLMQRKVAIYLKERDAEQRSRDLSEIDTKVMPHALKFMGDNLGLNHVFETLRTGSIPTLFNNRTGIPNLEFLDHSKTESKQGRNETGMSNLNNGSRNENEELKRKFEGATKMLNTSCIKRRKLY